MIKEQFPIVATTNMARALVFYRDLLGGTVSYEFPGPNGEPEYVTLDIGTSHLGIELTPGGAADGPRGMSLWVYAAEHT
ncbi:MAG: VOC family protein [Candidatus Limnocylindria bacterium]